MPKKAIPRVHTMGNFEHGIISGVPPTVVTWDFTPYQAPCLFALLEDLNLGLSSDLLMPD